MNEKLLKTTQKVAELCHLLGYRGCISVDTVETNDGEIAVTEVNCRYIISTPMYEVSEAIGGYRRLSEATKAMRSHSSPHKPVAFVASITSRVSCSIASSAGQVDQDPLCETRFGNSGSD